MRDGTPAGRWIRRTLTVLSCLACVPREVPAQAAAGVVRLGTPAESTLTNDLFSRAVRRGRALLNATRDSLPRNVGNNLRCTSCHLDDGTRAFAMPWVGIYARFPQERSRSGRVDLIEHRINDCFARSLNGRPLAPIGRDMRDIVSYMRWLSNSIPVGQRVAGQGLDSVRGVTPNAARGSRVFLEQCARCHGPDGEGMAGQNGLPYSPPLWGAKSFNIGAGMARQWAAAAFVRRNMPSDQPGTMSAQDAADVAAWVVSRPRPDFAGKERDWPRGDAPPDVAYKTNRGRRP
jgi:thiosulfate dehydrogenase